MFKEYPKLVKPKGKPKVIVHNKKEEEEVLSIKPEGKGKK